MKRNSKKTPEKKEKKQTERKNRKTKPDAADGLRALFISELKKIYWVENALTKVIPKMIKNATSEELSQALNTHLEIIKNQVTRLEKVFSSIGEKAVAKKCELMAGLIKETEEIMKGTEKGAVRDAGIILAGQKVGHYEIGTYGALVSFAKILGVYVAESLLKETLDEEKDADEKLSEIAEFSINIKAASFNEIDNNVLLSA